MTPLAQRVARELTMVKAKRTLDDHANVLDLIGQEMHCFEVSAIADNVNHAMAVDNIWGDVGTILPRLFLPSPVTWLERLVKLDGEQYRIAYVLQRRGNRYKVALVKGTRDNFYSVNLCEFWPRSAVEGDPVGISVLEDPEPDSNTMLADPLVQAALARGKQPHLLTEQQRLADMALLKRARDFHTAHIYNLNTFIKSQHDKNEVLRGIRHSVATTALTIDLINTPGLVGLKQHDPHKGLLKQLANVGRYPLHSWSEVVVKAHSEIAPEGDRITGHSYHKCLHFVRSHIRRYKRDKREVIIPAHWRGDPALGIKRTRYVVVP